LETLAGSSEYDLVITDLNMPGVGGSRSHVPRYGDLVRRVVIMSGSLGENDEEAVRALGIPILRKPFTMADVHKMLDANNQFDRGNRARAWQA